MTRQQAGVSAEAVAKLVEKWETISKLYGAPDAVRDAVYQQCAEELKATFLGNADKPQCCCNVSWLDLDIDDCPIHGPKAKQPKAVSAGALSGPDGYAFRYPDGIRFTTGEAINGSRPLDSIPYYFESSLAAHDQKVRAETLEEAAQVIDQCNREGPYNAIQGASRIRALASGAEEKEK